MEQINSDIFRQFESQGLTINEGITVDARLVKSASRFMSNQKLKEYSQKLNTPEGRLDKNDKQVKFRQDLGSDRVVQKEIIHYGLKEQASVNTNHGFVEPKGPLNCTYCWTMTAICPRLPIFPAVKNTM